MVVILISANYPQLGNILKLSLLRGQELNPASLAVAS
jgi:hypothetical protein